MKKSRVSSFNIVFPMLFFLISFACVLPTFDNSMDTDALDNTIYETEILIWVEVPEETPENTIIQLVLVDEVSGLDFNSKYIDMLKVDRTHYGVVLRVQIGSIIKYRYARSGGNSSFEHTSNDEEVRYRIYYADGPGEVHDIVSKWEDSEIIREMGKISGSILDFETNDPIENMLVSVGGQQVLTLPDGSFELTNLPSGQHQLVAYSLNGNHKTFKQNLIVKKDLTTPVNILVEESNWVEVIFTVTVPDETVPAVPLRLAGNLLQFGNRFLDLGGSISGSPDSMPIMKEIEPNKYQTTLSLPAGADFRYKYTQGDGFWNAERDSDGELNTRQFIVPSDIFEISINDSVISWKSDDYAGIWFDLSVPADLSIEDEIFIQYYQGGWMAKIPMWHIQENRWAYKLLGPTGIGELIYRYCINELCEGDNARNYPVVIVRNTISNFSESPYLKDVIVNWD